MYKNFKYTLPKDYPYGRIAEYKMQELTRFNYIKNDKRFYLLTLYYSVVNLTLEYLLKIENKYLPKTHITYNMITDLLEEITLENIDPTLVKNVLTVLRYIEEVEKYNIDADTLTAEELEEIKYSLIPYYNKVLKSLEFHSLTQSSLNSFVEENTTNKNTSSLETLSF